MPFREKRVARNDRLRPTDVVGVPALPPAGLVRVTATLRSSLSWLHRTTAPPPLQILEALLGALDTAALAAFCRLGIPERLQGPMTPAALADHIGVEVEELERLVQFAAARGWVRVGRDGRVRPTRATAFLRDDHPGGWRAWIEFASSPEVARAIAAFPEACGAGAVAFEVAHGSPFFEWMSEHPDRHAVFDRAMNAGGRLHALALAAALDWETTRRVCDVGGGTGTLLAGLIGAKAHLTGVLFDLPDVVARAGPHDRIEISGGDAFERVPPGCDTYLLVNVLHDWGDDDALALLSNTAAVLPPGGRVIVVDGERPSRPRDTIATRTDLLMLMLTGTGRERTTREFADLGARAGLRLDRSVDLVSADRAHVFVSLAVFGDGLPRRGDRGPD